MDFIKKVGKEVSVFGLVAVIFLALYAYRSFTHVEIKTINEKELATKIESKDNFVLVVGSELDTETQTYKDICLKYMEKNHGNQIYFLDITDQEHPVQYVQDTFDVEDGNYPATFVYKDGKIKKHKTGTLSYYRIAELFK